MTTITPKEQCLNLFIEFVYKCYHSRLSRLTKIKNEADKEIEDLHALRKLLVEKNLNGVYSDEIFKEQSTMIADKMLRAQVVKDDSTMDKYNIDAVTAFIKTILADLGETYRRSTIGQLKVLLGSIFPHGVAWDYSGTLNPQISPIFQYIQHFDGGAIPSGAGNGNRTRIYYLGSSHSTTELYPRSVYLGNFITCPTSIRLGLVRLLAFATSLNLYPSA